jgi:trk system potassium uptake protein TrkA
MYVIIAGGGDIGYHLTKALHQHGYEVLLIEKNRKRAMDLADDLGERVMYGDACEVRVLNEAGARRADVVVAATGDDEDNLIISQLSQNFFKVKRVLAVVRDPRTSRSFSDWASTKPSAAPASSSTSWSRRWNTARCCPSARLCAAKSR